MKANLPLRRSASLSAKPILLSQLLDAPLHLGRALVPLGTASSTKAQRLSPPTFPTATSSQVLKTSQVARWKIQRRTLATFSGIWAKMIVLCSTFGFFFRRSINLIIIFRQGECVLQSEFVELPKVFLFCCKKRPTKTTQ